MNCLNWDFCPIQYHYLDEYSQEGLAEGSCTGCGRCEKHCPQQIAIREELKNAHRELDNRLLRFGLRMATRAVGFRRD